jgi:hypothetical protein
MATSKSKKPKCEVNHVFGCTGVAIRSYKGKKKDDPVFHGCLGCITMLRRMGVQFKEYNEKS